VKSFQVAFACLFIFIGTYAQERVLVRAHAHNDYAQKHPLFDALFYGFNSVEADVHLLSGKLYVSHATPMQSSAKTLDQLYLKPLDSLIRLNNGSVYKNSDGPFFLMIDFKTSGKETYQKLMEVLNPYRNLLSGKKPSLVIFISGDRPVDLIVNDERALVSLDGRPSDLGMNFGSKIMPVVSIDFKSLSNWNGSGQMPEEDFRTIQSLARKVHDENKKLRLWAIPDQPNAWKILSDAGVDLINTDRLKELSEFLNND
jgi:hypothetical protein